jgi:hypothetical protein
MKEVFKFLEAMSQKRVVASCILMIVCVLGIDFVTGKEIRFPILFALPVGLAAWRNYKTAAYAMAVGLPLARMAFHLPWHATVETLPVAGINALINMLALLCYAYLLDKTAVQKKALETRVNVLEGILPICASCKKIRNENGEYEQVEKYISERSQATFSHGVCPECLKRLYPWYSDKAKT